MCSFISKVLPLACLQEASAKVNSFAANANKLRDLTGRATRTLQQTIAAIEAELQVIFVCPQLAPADFMT